MRGKASLLALLTIGLVGLPLASSAEIYHHVHHRSPDAIAAAQWYMDHMDCKDYGREGACQVDNIRYCFTPMGPTDRAKCWSRHGPHWFLVS